MTNKDIQRIFNKLNTMCAFDIPSFWTTDKNGKKQYKVIPDKWHKGYLQALDDAEKMLSEDGIGLYAESSDDGYMHGDELHEGDTIYLLGVEGKVCYDCGAWGWGSHEYVPWDELEKKIPNNNTPTFCYNDNFISFWELKWNFDNGCDWDGVPFIRKERQ